MPDVRMSAYKTSGAVFPYVKDTVLPHEIASPDAKQTSRFALKVEQRVLKVTIKLHDRIQHGVRDIR